MRSEAGSFTREEEHAQSGRFSKGEVIGVKTTEREGLKVNAKKNTCEGGVVKISKELETRAGNQGAENRSLVSGNYSLILEKEKSGSLNLIDGSLNTLRKLMDTAESASEVTPQHIVAACHCATNIVNLLRLKMEVIKVSQQ